SLRLRQCEVSRCDSRRRGGACLSLAIRESVLSSHHAVLSLGRHGEPAGRRKLYVALGFPGCGSLGRLGDLDKEQPRPSFWSVSPGCPVLCACRLSLGQLFKLAPDRFSEGRQ